MPEYLAPGVFVEEVSFRAKSIEGVSTTTTGFIGAARFGPVALEPDILTSLTDYERLLAQHLGVRHWLRDRRGRRRKDRLRGDDCECRVRG